MKDNKCKWNFAPCPDGVMEQGPNNPLWEHFRSQSKYDTLVREAIQNSLDAVSDESKPVRMEFAFERLENPDKHLPGFLKIKDHIQGCIDYWHDNKDSKRICKPMLDYLCECTASLPYLRVSDYNTKGMDYRKGDNNCSFFGFLRGQGTSVKSNSTSGGSFGFGKTAYFGFSEFYTILISSKNQQDNVVFEGASMLCTNKVGGKKYMDVGYYDNQNGLPITDSSDIPDKFRRTEAGTDINVMGVFDTPEAKKQTITEIVQCVLKNFWMAILMCKLEVKVGKNCINASNLPKLIESVYQVKADNTPNYENPRPYYEAVKQSLINNDGCKHYEEVMPTLGRVHFYIIRNPYNRDRVIAMRRPMMVVKAYNLHSQKGFAGVFVCEDVTGNELLRMTEPPTHTSWDMERVSEKNNPQQQKAQKALLEVRTFIGNKITEFYFNDLNDESEFIGIEDYLYSVDEDTQATPSDQQTKGNSETGKETGESTEKITSSPTTSLNPDIPTYTITTSNNDKIGQVSIKKTGTAKKDKDGNLLSGNGKKKRNHPGGGGVGSKSADNTNKQDDDGKQGSYQKPFPVTYRCFAQEETEGTTYTLKFYPDSIDEEGNPLTTDKGIINIFVIGADGEKEKVPIKWSSVGTVIENAIHGLQVTSGVNVLQFRFNDNMKHTIYLEAYEQK